MPVLLRRETFSIMLGACGLMVDSRGSEWPIKGEHLVDIIIWLIFLVSFLQRDRLGKAEMIAVLVFFTPSEFCFTEGPIPGGRHYYQYQERGKHRLMPAFVPPAHWCLLDLGRRFSHHIPFEKRWWPFALISPLLPPSLYFAYTGADTCGIIFMALLLLFLWLGPQPRLYATMTWLALLMEVVGTQLGNWEWYRHVPFPYGWTVLNPPILIGVGYAFFDLVINVVVDHIDRASNPPPKDYLPIV